MIHAARRPLRLAAAMSAFTVFASLGAPARAEDAVGEPAKPAAPSAPEHKLLAKIDNAFLLGMVGSWKIAAKSTTAGDATGESRVRSVAGGTALLQETEVIAGDRTYRSLSVLRVADGGKEVRTWRFDAAGGGVLLLLKGPLSADGFEASGEDGFAVKATKTDGGFETSVLRNGKPFSTSTYTKADKDVEFAAPDALKEGMRSQMIGAWDVVGEWTVPGKDGKPAAMPTKGTSSFRWALGGSAILHDYDMTSVEGPSQAVGVHLGSPDGATTRIWFFENDRVEPLEAEGPTTADSWDGKSETPRGELALHWKKKGDGFEMTFEMGGQPAGRETYTRKK